MTLAVTFAKNDHNESEDQGSPTCRFRFVDCRKLRSNAGYCKLVWAAFLVDWLPKPGIGPTMKA
jgi:hypothetical protein